MNLDRLIHIPGTNLTVSRLCLGGAALGGALSQDASFTLLDSFLEQGGNFIDTAHVYSDWLLGVERSCSEKTLGRWLASRGLKSQIVVGTKIGHPDLAHPTVPRLDRTSLRADVEACLSNLGLDALDLVYIHRDEPSRPVPELLAPLDELRREGLIRHYAASNWSAARIEEGQAAAQAAGWQGFIANQPEWSLAQRNPGTAAADLVQLDKKLYALHARTGLTAIPYSSQARGYFDKVSAGTLDKDTAKAFHNKANRAMAGRLSVISSELGGSATAVALAVLMRAPFPTIPVIGCHTPGQVASSFAALQIALSDEVAGKLLSDDGPGTRIKQGQNFLARLFRSARTG